MFQKLVRLLVRLFFFALIAGAVGFVITRLMGGEDDDFEDFEDLESSFEFNETPVEIDVSGPAISESSIMNSDSGSDDAHETRAESYSSNPTVALDEQTDESDQTSDLVSNGPRLIDIKGIGPSYEARLKAMGINSMSDLLGADSEQVADQANVIGGATEVEDWKDQARSMTANEQE